MLQRSIPRQKLANSQLFATSVRGCTKSKFGAPEAEMFNPSAPWGS